MVESIDLSNKETFYLIRMTWPGGARYWTDWSSDVVFEGNTYVATPDMLIKLPKNDGLFADQDFRVAVQLSDDPEDITRRLTSGAPHPGVTLEGIEIIQSIDGGGQRVTNKVFSGTIVKARRNFEGHRRSCVFQALTIKGRVEDIAMGLPANHECVHNLGDSGCGVSIAVGSGNAYNVEVVSILDRVLTFTAGSQDTLDAIAAKQDRFFRLGYLEHQGLAIEVYDWNVAAPYKINLRRRAPDFWIGQQVKLVAGCDRSVETCRNHFNNEQYFLGCGLGIPAYNPLWEDNPGT